MTLIDGLPLLYEGYHAFLPVFGGNVDLIELLFHFIAILNAELCAFIDGLFGAAQSYGGVGYDLPCNGQCLL